MKKAFTMLELILVVVVIGIISAFAIPKIFGSKKDAEILKLKTQVSEINKSIKAYANSKMVLSGNMDEEENYPKSLNENGVLLGKVLSGADTSKWAQDTIGGVPQEHLYMFYLGKHNKQGYNAFWCAYAINESAINGLRKYNSSIDWNVGDFKCYQYKDANGKINNDYIKTVFN